MRHVIEAEVYRGPAGGIGLPLVATGCSLALLALGMSRPVKGWVIGVLALLLVYNVYLVLWLPFEVSVASDGLLTFRSLVRRRVVHVEDVRHIRRTTGQGGGLFLKFTFSRGSVRMVRSRRVDALETRLRKVNPSIQ